MSIRVQIDPTGTSQFYFSRSGNVRICADDVHLLDGRHLIAYREAKWPFIPQLYVLDVRRELIYVTADLDVTRAP